MRGWPWSCQVMSSADRLGQLVQPSVAGLVVAVAAPPVAVTPVRDGMEKYVLAHAAGDDELIVASLVMVTVSVLFAATVNGEVSVCEEPLVAVANPQETRLVDDVHPALALVSALSE